MICLKNVAACKQFHFQKYFYPIVLALPGELIKGVASVS